MAGRVAGTCAAAQPPHARKVLSQHCLHPLQVDTLQQEAEGLPARKRQGLATLLERAGQYASLAPAQRAALLADVIATLGVDMAQGSAARWEQRAMDGELGAHACME